jgi:hypothetical protein
MNSSPFRTYRQEFVRHGPANFSNVHGSKSALVEQGYRAMRTIQREPRQCAATPEGVDMRWRVIVRIDHHSDISDR